ncbi:hypothetical protein [Hymenobacter yonginensis]|uniref:hypothetical protein n=1 Tax=Hymenobacter yonginensis TaxID=748197 RepID=UPI0038CC1AD2
MADLIYKIKDLRKLKRLDLSACQLDSLPVQVGLLQHVAVLNLSNNHLTSLPNSIRDMHSLREVVFCQYEEEFRQWPREEKLRAVALVPHGHVILLDCFSGVHGRYRLGKLRVKVTEHKLWQ